MGGIRETGGGKEEKRCRGGVGEMRRWEVGVGGGVCGKDLPFTRFANCCFGLLFNNCDLSLYRVRICVVKLWKSDIGGTKARYIQHFMYCQFNVPFLEETVHHML